MTDGVLTPIPGPVEAWEMKLNEASGGEFEQGLSDANKHRPTTDTTRRTTLIMAKSEFFGFIKVDLDEGSAGISSDRSSGFQLEVGGEQIPGLELGQVWDQDHQDADATGLTRLQAAEQDF